MLRTETVASYIEEGLNAFGLKCSPQYKFVLYADMAENKNTGAIRGIVTRIKGDPANLSNKIDIEYSYVCKLQVPSFNSNCNVTKIQGIVDSFIERNNGKEFSINQGKGLFTFSMSNVDPCENSYGDNDYAIVFFNINVKYTKNFITSNNKHWFLNDIEIPFESESVLINKDGVMKKVNSESYSKAELTGQERVYKFIFPYADNELCIMLQKDMLSGDFEKVYELKFYDGQSFKEDEPFITSVSIYKSADSGVELTKTSKFNISFTDVDSGNGDTKYYLALCDSVFDNNSINTRFFEPKDGKSAREIQIEYWEDKIKSGCAYEQIKAPNIDSIYITSQIYRNTQNYELFDLVNKNYAVLKVERKDKPAEYYYYFVTSSVIGAKKQIKLELKLDTIQTYFFNQNVKFGDCVINRAHLNRWIDCGDGQVKFDGGLESSLFLSEQLGSSPKQLMSMKEIKWKITDNDDINKWLNDNIDYWVYTYLDRTHNYIGYTTDGQKRDNINGIDFCSETESGSGKSVQNVYMILCYPIFKKNSYKHIYFIHNSIKYNINESAMIDFENHNNGVSYIFNRKISIIPPFRTASYKEIDEEGNLVIDTNTSDGVVNPAIGNEVRVFLTNASASTPLRTALFGGCVQSEKPLESYEMTLGDFKFVFTKDEIINSASNKKYNPKLYSGDNITIRLKGFDGSYFDYDLQKLNTDKLIFLYNETLQPEITKYYCRIKAPTGLYIEDTSKSFLGLVGSTDTSIALASDQYQQFLANNKNFWLQSSLRIVNESIGDIGRSMVAGSSIGTLGGKVTGGMNLLTQAVDKALTCDNMKEAPDTLRNAGGNVLFSLQIKPLGFYIEVHNALDCVLKNRNDYNCLYGYSYDMIDNIKNVVDTRKYYNYVKAEIDAIWGESISSIVRGDIKQRFEEGIRFWNSDTIQYDYENYEKWLEK